MKKSGGGRIVNISSLGGIRPWGHVRALLRVEGRRDHADARAGEGVRPRDHGELGGAGSDSRFERGSAGARSDRRDSGASARARRKRSRTAVLYFMNASNFVTGQVLAVDGGLSQR